jgi:hypothetical protein
MKHLVKYIIFAILMVLSISATIAQNGARFPRVRERIAEARLREVKEALNLDQARFGRFAPIYRAYERDLATVNGGKIGRLLRVNADSLQSDEAEMMVLNQLNAAKNLVIIREKYYHEFRKVLQPQEIIKLYQTEAAIRKKVAQEVRKRMMNR